MPFVLIAALAISAVTGGTSGGQPTSASGPLPAVTAPVPPNAAAQTGPCTKLLAALPVSLDGLPQRVVHTRPDSPFVVAWGSRPIVLSCGAARPKSLTPGSGVRFRYDDGVAFDLVPAHGAATYTTVDRAPYIAITFPAGVQAADHLPTLAATIAEALPAVCTTNPAVADVGKLCTRRP